MILETGPRSIELDTKYQGYWYCYTCSAYVDSINPNPPEHGAHDVSKCETLPPKECC